MSASLLLFQVSFQSVDVSRDGSNLRSQGSDRVLLLCNLGCEVGSELGTIFAAFGSGHKISAFLLCIVVLV